MQMRFFTLLVCCCLALTACAGGTGGVSKPKTPVAMALAEAARDAAKSGQVDDQLLFAEQLYEKNPHDTDAMVGYARALRHSGMLTEAKLVVQSAARQPRAATALMAEYANLLIAEGNYTEAQSIASKAVDANPGNADAQHALALALSGLGKDKEAEEHFRTALLRWPDGRDKTPVINNLAMNLASQGRLKEARTIMELATGDALKSDAYRNNRAMLGALKDEVPISALPALKPDSVVAAKLPKGAQKTTASQGKKWPLRTRVKMKPIL